jgi:hypothetical protein
MSTPWTKPYILERWEYARDRKMDYFETNAKENYRYYDGSGHWTEDERKVLAEDERPATVMNYVFKLINTFVGNEIQNRNDIHVFPMEGGDIALANILNYGYTFVKSNTRLDWKFTQAHLDGLITSQGWLMNKIGFDRSGKPRIRILNKNPLMMYFDPDSIELDFEDCQDIFESEFVYKPELIKKFPNKTKEIEAFWSADLDDHGVYIDRKKDLVRVLYAEYKKWEKRTYYVIRPKRGSFIYQETEPKRGEIPTGATVTTETDTVAQVYGTRILGDIVLEEPIKNPYGAGNDKFSYTVVSPYFVAGRGVAIVDQFKSMQDMINKSYSQAVDILNRQPKVGGFYEEGAIEDPDELEETARSGKWMGVKNIDKIKPLDPPDYPSAHMKLLSETIEYIKEIVGTPDVFMGEAPGRVESGLGIQILRRQAGLTFEMPADNLRLAQIEVGRKILNQMTEFWSRDKFMRVSGEDGNYDEISIKPTTITQTTVNRQGDVLNENSFTTRLREGEYDFVIDVTQPTVTQRMYNQMIATQIFQMMPRPELAPMLIDMLDFPQKDKWKEALGAAAEAMKQEAQAGQQQNPLQALMQGGGNGP